MPIFTKFLVGFSKVSDKRKQNFLNALHPQLFLIEYHHKSLKTYKLIQIICLLPLSTWCVQYLFKHNDNFPISIDPPYIYLYAAGTTYDQLKTNLTFLEDFAGVTNWIMRFPRVIYAADLKSRHVFNENTVDIQKVTNPQLEERWKYFVITKGDGRRYYCTAQIYYEKAPLKCKESALFSQARQIFKQFYVPKGLVLLSDLPYYKIQVNLLKVFRELKKAEPIISYSINEGLHKVYTYLVENQREDEWEHITVRQTHESKRITPSIEFAFNYYLQSCNQHKNGEAIFIEKATNREVLHLYKLYSNSFYEISYIFHLPFSTNTLRLILSAILQEKQIIFSSNNQNLTTLIIETLMRMILPLKWCYMYVPNLPPHLLEPAQQSFMPYIVGLPKRCLNQIDTSDRVVIFVEEDRLVYKGELLLFHQSLDQFLTYSNSDTKNYLEWEKQIRIKSIQLITSILEDCIQEENHSQLFTKRSLTSSTVVLSEPHIRSFNFINHHDPQHNHFINEFVKNSMMYKHYKEDVSRGLGEENTRLLQMPKQQRKSFLLNKFNFLSSQAQYPARYDNEKKWIKYYDKITRNRRKFRFNRYSLNVLEQTPYAANYASTSSSMIASSVKLADSRTLTQSTIFH